jgi:hypothetical protein
MEGAATGRYDDELLTRGEVAPKLLGRLETVVEPALNVLGVERKLGAELWLGVARTADS